MGGRKLGRPAGAGLTGRRRTNIPSSDFLITHGDRALPPRGERFMRYTETPEPRAKCTMCAEGGTTSDSRRRFSGGVIEHGAFAGVHNAGV